MSAGKTKKVLRTSLMVAAMLVIGLISSILPCVGSVLAGVVAPWLWLRWEKTPASHATGRGAIAGLIAGIGVSASFLLPMASEGGIVFDDLLLVSLMDLFPAVLVGTAMGWFVGRRRRQRVEPEPDLSRTSQEETHWVSGSIVSIPLRPPFFEFVGGALDDKSLASSREIDVRLRPGTRFPQVCAWCFDQDVVGNKEIELRLVQKASLKERAKDSTLLYLIAHLPLPFLFKLMLLPDAPGRSITLTLEAPVCEEHQRASASPPFEIHRFDTDEMLCLLDLGDRFYAAEFYRANRPEA